MSDGEAVERLSPADAVVEAPAPANTAVTEATVPTDGVALMITVCPAGMLVPLTTIVTGLVALNGSKTSGELYAPLGLCGTLTPPMDAMVRTGIADGIMGPGEVTCVGTGFVEAVRLRVVYSRRILPAEPAPPV